VSGLVLCKQLSRNSSTSAAVVIVVVDVDDVAAEDDFSNLLNVRETFSSMAIASST